MGIFFILKILLIAGLIKLLGQTHKPLLCASLYVGVRLFFSILFGHTLGYLFVGSLIAGALASLYFWLLDYFERAGIIFWIIALGGFLIGLV
jgi:uncharacterized membrane protein